MNARHEDVPLADIPRYTWLLSRYPNFLASFIRPFREVAVRRFCLAIEQRLALMAAVLGMIARQGQPKSMPVVIAMATIAASRRELLFRVLRYLGGVLSRHQGPCVQRLRSLSPLARCSG